MIAHWQLRPGHGSGGVFRPMPPRHIVLRDVRGRFAKGRAGGPGRPPRDCLTEAFAADLFLVWRRHGKQALRQLCRATAKVIAAAASSAGSYSRPRPSHQKPCHTFPSYLAVGPRREWHSASVLHLDSVVAPPSAGASRPNLQVPPAGRLEQGRGKTDHSGLPKTERKNGAQK